MDWFIASSPLDRTIFAHDNGNEHFGISITAVTIKTKWLDKVPEINGGSK